MDSTRYIDLIKRIERVNLEIFTESIGAAKSGDLNHLKLLEQEAIVLKQITKIVCGILASRVEGEYEEDDEEI